MPTILTVNGRTPRLERGVYLAPDVTVAGDVHVDVGANVWFGCVLRSERERVAIGRETNIQDLTMVHADPGFPTIVGARVTVGHRAVLHGCTVGDDALIGMGAVVMNGAVVGEGAVVGAGAVVTEGTEIPPMTLAVGIPARPTDRPVPEVPRPHPSNYVELAAMYAEAEVARPG